MLAAINQFQTNPTRTPQVPSEKNIVSTYATTSVIEIVEKLLAAQSSRIQAARPVESGGDGVTSAECLYDTMAIHG